MGSRGTATDKLFDVVQVLQTARKTGLLTVTRDGTNNTVEQATVKFNSGQIVEASVGRLNGNDALDALTRWKMCYFIFQPAVSLYTSPPDPAPPARVGPATGNSNGREPPDGFYGSSGVPYRIRHPNEVLPYFDRLGLSRAHRHLFLLIDGKRSVPELMRLAGSYPEAVSIMLSDLERLGLIRQ